MSFLYAAFGAYLVGQIAPALVGLVRARREDIPVVLMALALWWRPPAGDTRALAARNSETTRDDIHNEDPNRLDRSMNAL